MTSFLSLTLPYAVLASHVLLVFLFAAVLFRGGWGRAVVRFVGRYALLLGTLITLAAVLGSLFYSEVIGFEACLLCWWQRVFIYPQLVLFALAWRTGDRSIFRYSSVLSAFAGVIALYHSYVYWGGESLLECTALGGACSKIYVMEFGYITIPSMSLTVALYLLLLAWVNRIYQRS